MVVGWQKGQEGKKRTKNIVFRGAGTRSPFKKAVEILLDGYNNPGFSGGPIVYRDLNQSGPLVLKLLGTFFYFFRRTDLRTECTATVKASHRTTRLVCENCRLTIWRNRSHLPMTHGEREPVKQILFRRFLAVRGFPLAIKLHHSRPAPDWHSGLH